MSGRASKEARTPEDKALCSLTPVEAALCPGVLIRVHLSIGGRLRVEAARRERWGSRLGESWEWYINHTEASVIADAVESAGKSGYEKIHWLAAEAAAMEASDAGE